MATGEETMKEVDVYLFGQILGTHSFLLKDGFLKPDEYSEIKEQYFLPGGETISILFGAKKPTNSR